jgi:CheY-like chemotaxis protein
MRRSGHSPLLLFADDVEDTREMYREFFELSGYRVITAVDGDDAIKMATDRQPAVIVMDLMMPRTDGWEATRRLKAHPLTRGIPVIALTGHGSRAADAAARGVSFDAFVTKPCVPERLLEEVQRVLARR